MTRLDRLRDQHALPPKNKSVQAGKRQHVYAYPGGKERGPGGYLIWDCERCGIQKTLIGQAGHWRMPGEEWKPGFVGCTPTPTPERKR